MTQKYKFKTYAVARAFVREPSWEPASAKAMLDEVKAPEEVLVRAASEEFDPMKDLLQVESVLVSTGKNRNDDVFLSKELSKVRSSGEHKPFNLEHDSKKIVGHMIRSFVTSKAGEELTEDQIDKELPEDFDITNEAVVYAYALPEVGEEIKKKAAAGQLFVSVEMWFTDYDYLVGSKLVARNESTSFLDDCLKANGGDGAFKGADVGRVLRNMLIGGIGFVEKPANSESVIKSISSLRSEEPKVVEVYSEPAIEKNIIEDYGRKSLSSQDKNKEESQMSEKLLEEIAETVKASTEAAIKEAEDKKNVESAKASESTKDTDSEISPDVKALMATVATLKDTVDTQTKTIAQMQHEKRISDRRATLATAGLSGEELQKAIELGADMSEGNFSSFCDLMTEAFNSKNLRTDASEGNQTENKENETEGSATAGDGDDNDAGDDTSEDDVNKTEASDDDTLIDLDKIEDVDADVGAGESKAEASIEERMHSAVASRLERRNKNWRRASAKTEE